MVADARHGAARRSGGAGRRAGRGRGRARGEAAGAPSVLQRSPRLMMKTPRRRRRCQPARGGGTLRIKNAIVEIDSRTSLQSYFLHIQEIL